MKKLIAYSSISHMGFVTLGFFMFGGGDRRLAARSASKGALVQMISHGFVSGAMFLCVGVMYDRVHSRQIADYGGVVNTMPKFAALFDAVRHGQLRPAGHLGLRRRVHGHPRRRQVQFLVGFTAAVTLILGAAYTLWMVKRVVFGAVGNDHVAELKDIGGREFLILGVLAVCVLAMGLYPFPFTEVMHASVDNLLKHVAMSKL
jgi:NADH-quinone oxidoreductase subunit M